MKTVFERASFAPRLRFDVPMAPLCTMKVGGPADALLEVATKEELCAALAFTNERQIPVTILGNGSNVVVSDWGIQGLVLLLGSAFSTIEPSDEFGHGYRVMAGASLIACAHQAQKDGLTGLEFAEGIPGTIGGAAIMNAGAYGGEMAQVIRRVHCLTPDGRHVTLSNNDCEFSYRHSLMLQAGLIVSSVCLALEPGDPAQIRQTMADFKARRSEKQPKGHSAGSFFKRPEGHFAGKLIEDCGLKGFTIGDARVSEKHAGFVLNNGHATASDIDALKTHIQQAVLERFGVMLEPEVRFIGRGF